MLLVILTIPFRPVEIYHSRKAKRALARWETVFFSAMSILARVRPWNGKYRVVAKCPFRPSVISQNPSFECADDRFIDIGDSRVRVAPSTLPSVIEYQEKRQK